MRMLTSIMSKMIPMVSPACMELPYLGPLELELCLSSPLYMAQPPGVSEKAYSIIISVESFIPNQKLYLCGTLLS